MISTGVSAVAPAGRLRVPDDGLTLNPDGALAVQCTACPLPVTDCRASVAVPDCPGWTITDEGLVEPVAANTGGLWASSA